MRLITFLEIEEDREGWHAVQSMGLQRVGHDLTRLNINKYAKEE